jgi:anti-sigma B factor antagonist
VSAAAASGLLRLPQPATTEPAPRAQPQPGEARSLRVRVVDAGCRTLLRVTGPVDGVTTPALGEALEPHRHDGRWLILDLRAVDYIESPGLRLIMALQTELQADGGQVCLVAQPHSRVERTLRLAGIEQLCPVFATVRQAWTGRSEAGASSLDRAA